MFVVVVVVNVDDYHGICSFVAGSNWLQEFFGVLKDELKLGVL